MTMTETTTTETSSALLELTWRQLADLSSAGASAATDQARVMLTGVHLFTRAGHLIAEATDSYSLVRVSIESDAPELDVIAPATWLDNARKAFKVAKSPDRPITLTITGTTPETRTVTATDGATTLVTPAIFGTWPRTDQLIPEEKDYTAELGAFNPQFLARMAKILPPDGPKDTTRAWRTLSMSRTKPAVWSTTNHRADAMFLLMPVRVD